MVKCYLLSAPAQKQNSIFENKEWGLKNEDREYWEKLQGNYAVILGWNKKLGDYVVVGLGKVERTFVDNTPNLLSKLEELLYSLTLVNQAFTTGLRNSKILLNLTAKKRSESS